MNTDTILNKAHENITSNTEHYVEDAVSEMKVLIALTRMTAGEDDGPNFRGLFTEVIRKRAADKIRIWQDLADETLENNDRVCLEETKRLDTYLVSCVEFIKGYGDTETPSAAETIRLLESTHETCGNIIMEMSTLSTLL